MVGKENDEIHTSDIRLKNIIEKPSIPDISNLRLIVFTWKDTLKDPKIHYGYSAQDVGKISSHLTIVNEGGSLSVNYSELHTLQIEQLKREIEYLKEKIKLLEKNL